MLLTRILSALVLIPLVLIGIFYSNSTVFFVLTAMLSLILAFEWSKLFKNSNKYSYAYCGIVLCIQALIYQIYKLGYYQVYNHLLYVFSVCLCILLFSLVLVYQFDQSNKIFQKIKYGKTTQAILGLILIIPFWFGVNDLKAIMQLGGTFTYVIIYCFLMVWTIDSGAYFVGKFFGSRKMISNVSPGKTFEGALGGLVSLLLLNYLINNYYGIVSYYNLVILSLIVFLFATFGDLFESMIKRISEVKDSGNIIPGHGGLLDRLDSIIVVIPVYCLILYSFVSL